MDEPKGERERSPVLTGPVGKAVLVLALPVLVKRRVCDLREAGLPVMGNLEGMAVGAPLARLLGDETERGRVLVIVADDNFGRDGQVGSQVVVCRLTGIP